MPKICSCAETKTQVVPICECGRNHSVNHSMCSQSGSIEDFATSSGHSPSCVIGIDFEPGSSSKQEYNAPDLASEIGLRHITIPSTDDVR